MKKMSSKDLTERQRRGKLILKKLNALFPDAQMILKYGNNWELLVAVQLSAQCTDKQVNKVTENLFKKYKTLDDYIHAKPAAFEKDIFSTGFYKNKTKNILAAAKYIKEKHNGKIPKTMAEMLLIPGVARKTANVVLGNAYGIVEGMAVDTHVMRLAKALDLSDATNAEGIEQDLLQIFPQKEWFSLTYKLIEYGRNYCPARKHDHQHCPLSGI